MNERGKFTYALLLAGSLCTAVPSFAEETVDTRINRLEQELAELKTQVHTKSIVNPGQAEATKKAESPSHLWSQPAQEQKFSFTVLPDSTHRMIPDRSLRVISPSGLSQKQPEITTPSGT